MWRNVLLGVVSVTVFFVLAEVGLRLSGKVTTNAVRSPDVETLDAIPGLFQPGLQFVDRILPDLPYQVTINSLGFRGAEFPRLPRPGVFRVLCLGDSYTFGPYVDDAETFPAVLGKMLAGQSPDGTPAEVINGGANGFSIQDDLVFLKTKALSLRPDLVILAFSQNDVRDLSKPRLQIDLMREHARLKSTFLLGPILKGLQYTAVFNGMQRTAAWLRGPRHDGEGSAGAEALWEKYRDLLVELAGVVRAGGARFLLVVWPSARQISGELPMDSQERLARYAGELGIDYLDLAPSVRAVEAAGAHAFLLPHDSHPSPAGYEGAARAIAARLRDEQAVTLNGVASIVRRRP